MRNSHLFFAFFLGLAASGPACEAAPEPWEGATASHYRTVIDPFWKTGEPCTFTGADGLILQCRRFVRPDARASVVVAHGVQASMIQYKEITHALVKAGFSVFLYDARGHGLSAGALPEKPRLVWVERFGKYVDDNQRFLEEIVKPSSRGPIFGLGHSMGAATLIMASQQKPDAYQALFLGAPMIQIRASGPLERSFVTLNVLLGKGREPVAQGRYEDGTFETSTFSDSGRFAIARAEYLAEPRAIRDGLSFGWLDEAYKVADWLQHSGEYATKPITIALGGQDAVVGEEGARSFCSAAPHCQIRRLDAPKHDIFGSSDDDLRTLLGWALETFSN